MRCQQPLTDFVFDSLDNHLNPCYTTQKPHNQAKNAPSPKGCHHQVHVKAISCRFKSCYLHQAKIIRTFSLLETGSDLSFSMLIRISTARLIDTFVKCKAGSLPLPAFFFTLYLHSFLSVVTILHTLADLLRIQRRQRCRLRMLWQEPEARALVSLFSSMP